MARLKIRIEGFININDEVLDSDNEFDIVQCMSDGLLSYEDMTMTVLDDDGDDCFEPLELSNDDMKQFLGIED